MNDRRRNCHARRRYQPGLGRLFGVLLAGVMALGGCAGRQPILVGYSAELTGRTSELGVDGRDGAQLAVDTINQQGGVMGRPLQLMIRDDRGDAETARQVDRELAQAHVVAILGHLTSAMTQAVIDQNNAAGVVMLSPTTSSANFTGKKDLFFRVIPDTRFLGRVMAEYIYSANITHVVGVYDLHNESYTYAWWQAFRERYWQLGGRIAREFAYSSDSVNLRKIAQELVNVKPEGVIFIASAFDCAMILQYARAQLPSTKFYSAAWAVTNELLTKGGRSVDGMELESVYNPFHNSPAYLAFVQAYQQRFARDPSLAASHSYEAVMVLAKALEKTGGESKDLPQALLQITDFPGLQGNISIDEYGDVERSIYIVSVSDGAFKLLKTVTP